MRATCKTKSNFDHLIKRAKEAGFRSLQHAAAAIRLTARRSIRKNRKPSPRGQPPHTHTRRLPRSIVYAVDKTRQMALVGTSYALIGPAGSPHEHGGEFRGHWFAQRPFMAPALDKNLPRLAGHWANSLAP